KLFTITYSFRDEPDSPHHRKQFLMLEWYRKNERYEKIMQDTKDLVTFCFEHMKKVKAPLRDTSAPNFQSATVSEIFKDILGIEILNFLELKDIKELLKKDFSDVPVPETPLEWDDYFFLLYLNKIEPEISKIPALLLYEFPNHLSALSTIKTTDTRVCER